MMAFIAFIASHRAEFAARLGEHVVLVLVSTAIAAAIGVPLGILAARRPSIAKPIVALATGDAAAAEALVRWERPGIGLVPPLDFIPLAEECGLIEPIGAWVMRHAAQEVDAWARDGLIGSGFTLSVNVSPSQLMSHTLQPLVEDVLAGW